MTKDKAYEIARAVEEIDDFIVFMEEVAKIAFECEMNRYYNKYLKPFCRKNLIAEKKN